MLVLTLGKGDSLMIGDEVTVTVIAIDGKTVRLATQAPKHIPVHREEIYQRIHAKTLENDTSDDARKSTAPKTVLKLLSSVLKNT